MDEEFSKFIADALMLRSEEVGYAQERVKRAQQELAAAMNDLVIQEEVFKEWMERLAKLGLIPPLRRPIHRNGDAEDQLNSE